MMVMNQWTLDTRTRPVTRPHERTEPLVVGDVLYVANLNGRLLCVHRHKGYILWEKKFEHAIEGALGYGRSKIFVGDSQGNLYALNTRNGSQAWKFTIHSEWLSAPVVKKDRVYIMAGDDNLYVLNAETGKEIWHYSRSGDEKMTIRGTSSPALFGSEVYVGFSDGTLAALSQARGEELWVRQLRRRDRFYDVDMTPLVDQQGVVAATFDGRTLRMNRLTGETLWSFPVGSHSGFVSDGERLYFAGLNKNFYALDLQTGQVIWKTPYSQGVGFKPTRLQNGLLVFATSADPQYLIDSKDGKILWETYLGAGSMVPVASLVDDWFYSMSNYGNLWGYKLFPGIGPISTEPQSVGLMSALRKNP